MATIYIIINHIHLLRETPPFFYIGSDQHDRTIEEYSGSSKSLQIDIEKYGLSNFSKLTLEKVDVENNILREQYEEKWLRLYDVASNLKFYNRSIAGPGINLAKMSKQEIILWKKRISETLKEKWLAKSDDEKQLIIEGMLNSWKCEEEKNRIILKKTQSYNNRSDEEKALTSKKQSIKQKDRNWYTNILTGKSIKVFDTDLKLRNGIWINTMSESHCEAIKIGRKNGKVPEQSRIEKEKARQRMLGNKTATGRKWFNDGIKSFMRYPNDPIIEINNWNMARIGWKKN